jgi:hypothetical protein
MHTFRSVICRDVGAALLAIGEIHLMAMLHP